MADTNITDSTLTKARDFDKEVKMKEYKIVCTVDTINAKGEIKRIDTTSPILSGATRMHEVTKDIDRAKMLLGKAECRADGHDVKINMQTYELTLY